MALSINTGGYIVAEGMGNDSGTMAASVTTTGSNRIGYVALCGSKFSGGSMGVTWGGVSMTVVEDRLAGTVYAALFKIVNPSTAGSTVAWAGGNSTIGGIIAFSTQDNDQTTPTGTTSEGDSNTLAISSTTGEIAIATLFTYSGSAPTVDSPATLLATVGTGGFNATVAYVAGTSPTSTITFSGGAPIVGVSLKPISSTVVGNSFFTRLIGNGSQL